MKKLAASLTLLAGSTALSSCSDPMLDIEQGVNTMESCFPELYEKVDQLLVIAETWRANEAPANPANVPGLNATVSGGVITVDYTLPATTCRIDMTIRFYSPAGVEQSLTIAQDSLSNMIEQAATELGVTLFPSQIPFMVGTWTYSDGFGGSGSGALTGLIGGMNQNELVRLISTESTPMGGVPDPGSGMISLTTTMGDPCSLSFGTANPSHLETDTPAAQTYPVGTVTVSVSGPEEDVGGSIAMDGTSTATITTLLPGGFTVDLETFEVTYTP